MRAALLAPLLALRLIPLLALLLAGCGALPAPVNAARLPPGEFAGPDPDVAAVRYAAAAFSSQSSTYGDPAAGAEAALAMDYLAGALNTAPRWVGVDADTKAQALAGRDAVRAALGVAPGAASQTVVDALSAARRSLQAGNPAGAAAALRAPAFTLGGAGTVAALGNLPYLQPANAATLRAAEAVGGEGDAPGVGRGEMPL